MIHPTALSMQNLEEQAAKVVEIQSLKARFVLQGWFRFAQIHLDHFIYLYFTIYNFVLLLQI